MITFTQDDFYVIWKEVDELMGREKNDIRWMCNLLWKADVFYNYWTVKRGDNGEDKDGLLRNTVDMTPETIN